MSLKSFIKFVELRTKVASVFPLLVGTMYTLYHFKILHVANFLLFFLSLIFFDMATTAINNYIGSKEEVYHQNDENFFTRKHFFMIILLISMAMIFGIVLVVKTNIIVLGIGVISFSVGVFYTFGPLPILKMPLGEIFSGFFMGFVIVFLSIYIHVFDKDLIGIFLKQGILSFNINLIECIKIFLVSIPLICTIANIMLANNICDLDKDIKNNRFTLPYYIGRNKSLVLFKCLYYISFLTFIVNSVLRIFSPVILLTLIAFPIVEKNIKVFLKDQIKSKTFSISVKNFLVISIFYLVSIIANILWITFKF